MTKATFKVNYFIQNIKTFRERDQDFQQITTRLDNPVLCFVFKPYHVTG